MVVCEECQEWFHLECLGITEDEARALPSFVCGWCQSTLTVEVKDQELVVWNVCKVPVAACVAGISTAVSLRHPDITPVVQAAKRRRVEEHWTGCQTWAELEALIVEDAERITRLEVADKQQADEIIKGLGHHGKDMSAGGRTVDAPIDDNLRDQALVEFFENEGRGVA